MKTKILSFLIVLSLIFPFGFYSIPQAYALDQIDYCISDIDSKVSSTFAQGSGWNMTVSGDNCIFQNWDPIIDNYVYDSSGHIGPWTLGPNTSTTINLLGDHPSNDNEYRAYFDWSISPMKVGINITNTLFLVNVSSISDTFHFHNLTKNPLTSSASEIFNDTEDGTEYYSSNFGGSPGVKTVDLGTTADSELSTLRNASQTRFGVGIHLFIQQSWSGVYSEESPGNNYPNILKVTFVIPTEDPGFGSLTLSSDQDSLFTSQSFTLTANYAYGGSGISGLTITFQRSSDDSTWTNILNQTTDSNGNSIINYAEPEAGTWYFRSHYPGDSYSASNSSSVEIEVKQMPGSKSKPPGQGPSPSPGETPPSQDRGILENIWCFFVDCEQKVNTLVLYVNENSLFTNELLKMEANLNIVGEIDIRDNIIDFQISHDSSTWLSLKEVRTSPQGRSFLNYGHGWEPGIYYFRSIFPGDELHESLESNIEKVTFSLDPEGDLIPGDPFPLGKPELPPGVIQPEDLPTDISILPFGTEGFVPYDSLDPITKALVDALMFLTGQTKSFLETAEGIVEAVPEATVLIAWGLVLLMILILIAIMVFGRGTTFRG